MRISQIMLTKKFGGGERLFVDLCLSLAEAGHTIQAIYHADFVERQQLLDKPNIVCQPITVWGSWDKFAAWRIYRAVNAFGPALLHTHLARAAHLAGFAARRLHLPLIATLHNYVKLNYYRHVDKFVAITADQRQYLLQNGISTERIARIPNFSRLPPNTAPRQPSAARLRYISFARMVEEKGLHILLRAFKKIMDDGIDAELILGGDGPERNALEELAQSLEISPRVSFTGWVRDVPAFLSSGDIFVLPSLHETFGIAVLEAMACGIPIIATLTPGPRELLDEEMAYLVPVGDSEALAAAMCQVTVEPEMRATKAERALDSYRRQYCMEAVVPEYLALFENVATKVHSGCSESP